MSDYVGMIQKRTQRTTYNVLIIKCSPDDLVHCTQLVGAQWAVIHIDLLSTAEAAFSLLPPDTLKKVWVIGDAAGTSTIDDLAAHDPLPPGIQVGV